MQDVILVMPAQDEAHTISSLIAEIRALGFHDILVVDDYSSDLTANIAKTAGAKVISLPYNMGAWKATQTGIRYALKNGYNHAITMDADGQHSPRDLAKLLAKSKEGYDVVIGSCIERGSKARLLAWKIFKVMSQLNINDLTSGFRVYNRASIEVLASRKATMLEYQDMGVLFLIKHFGLKYVEVPVDMRERQSGISRIFSSWFAVINYMIYSVILMAAKTVPYNYRKLKLQMLKDNKLD